MVKCLSLRPEHLGEPNCIPINLRDAKKQVKEAFKETNAFPDIRISYGNMPERDVKRFELWVPTICDDMIKMWRA